ncbi:MAG: hydantoinase/oxoprolinase family protein [Rhodospirillales bacterium]|jgi:N-methylhydantoinase A|nr:hydantoinase/oxoprolinase family protein [Rhodospirillales bacterium]
MLRIGIDIGGTFTDFAVWRRGAGADTAIKSFKVPSSPPHFAEAVREGLEVLLADVTVEPDEPVFVMHGTTVSTNSVIERSGPRLAMLTTKGFKDLLELQRLRLKVPTNLFSTRTKSLVPRELIFEIDERLLSDGSERQPIDLDQAVTAATAAKADGVSSLAICFLHGYRNPSHEQAARDAIAASVNGLDMSLSSEVWPQLGEYERAITCVLNAYVKDRMDTYLGEIEAYLRERLPASRLFITKSNGGVMAAREARSFPVHTLLSGPASGVTAARFLGQMLDEPDLLTMDMGGTSTDLSLIRGGAPMVSTDSEVGEFPLMMPVTGIEAIGAGGGSIAWMDGTVLRIGPKSAGARPGPACYGQGGTAPTLTDAYLLCGYLDPNHFLGGRMALRRDLAEDAMAPIAEALAMDVTAAAEACVAVATSNMVARLLPYLAKVGIDPPELTLVLYGGAGAVHGPLLASEVGIGRIVVPRTPSIFCAYGGLVCGLVHDTVRTVHGEAMTPGVLKRTFAQLESEGRQWLARQDCEGYLTGSEIEHSAEMRYRGQSFQTTVPLSAQAIAGKDLALVEADFHAEHERLYSHADPSAPVEYIELRTRILGTLDAPRPSPVKRAGGGDAPTGHKALRLDGRAFDDCAVYQRDDLEPSRHVAGPAVIEQADATVLVPNGFAAEVAAHGDLVLTRET